MTPQEHVNFFVRCLLLLCIMLCRQLPRSYDIHIDRERFLGAFSGSYNGKHIQPTQWHLGPDGAVHQDPDPEAPRQQACKRYIEFYEHVAPGIHRAPNTYPQPEGVKGRQKKKTQGPLGPKEPSEKKRKRDAKLEKIKQQASEQGARAATLGAGGLNPNWDAALEENQHHSEGNEEPASKRRRGNYEKDAVEGRGSAIHSRQQPPCQDVSGADDDGATIRSRETMNAARLNGDKHVHSSLEKRTEPDNNEDRQSETEDNQQVQNTQERQPYEENGERETSPLTELETEDESEQHDGGEECSDDEGSAICWMDDMHRNQIATDGEEIARASTKLTKKTTAATARGFVAKFNKAALQREIQRARDAIGQLERMDTHILQNAFSVLAQIDVGGVSSTSLSAKPDDALRILEAIDVMRVNAEWHHVWCNIFRQRVMLCEKYLVDHITNKLADTARNIAQSESISVRAEEQDYFTRIVKYVKDRVEAGLPIRLNSTSYIPEIRGGVIYSEEAPRKRYSREEAAEATVRSVISAVRCWFGLPDEYITSARAHFVGLVQEAYGPGALLLPHVWDTYTTMPGWTRDVQLTTRGNRKRRFEPQHHERFGEIVKTASAADRTSSTFALIHELKTTYNEMKELAYRAWQRQATQQIQIRGPRILSDFNADAEAAGGPEPTRRSEAQATDKVLKLLRAGYAATQPRGNATSELENEIRRNLDMYQPLREHGISRRRINGRQGQRLTRTHAATTSGFFSLLIFRNILFNAPYLHTEDISAADRRMLFNNDQDFIAHMAIIQDEYSIEDPERFFCKRNALSRKPMTGRETKTAHGYWRLAELCDVTRFDQEPAAFEAMMATLVTHDKAHKVPGFGALSKYLTVADMCETGLVEHPTTTEMGRCVHQLNAGGTAGLKLLGYLTSGRGKHHEFEVVEAFERFFRDVSEALEPEEKERMEWNTIVAEHTLCKVKRLWTYIRNE
ncbi:hypothetical protein EIP86_000111 [Pleurotus ostreatoroseus]|nr:hypothetical protein EIP86_000111 [Pleurotus ostreatoroseus]